jgi:S1-C subfamily serine protease
VVVSEHGEILTAAHVVSGTSKVKVRFLDGAAAGASIIFSDTASDIAIIRLSGDYPAVAPAVLGDSDRVQVGQTALVIGVPLGAEHTLSVGHISARRRENEIFGGGVAAEMLQTDAAVNQGNSGGPLVNLKGEVIGIVSRILTTTGGSQGLGFAISSRTIKGVIGEDPVPWFGVHAVFVGAELTQVLHIPSEGALLVQSVMEGSPADKAGIRGGDLPAHLGEVRLLLGGDVILAIESQRTCHRECIAHEIRSQAGAEGLTLTLWREGREVRMEIPLEHPRILERTGQASEKGKEQER